MKRGKLALWLGLSLVLGVLIVIGRNGYGLGEKHAELSGLSAVMPTVGPVRDIIIAKGTVAYDHQFVLRSQIDGKVARLAVKEGDEVVRGQHLLRIVAPHEAVDLDLRRLELQRAQTKLSAINKELTATRRLVEVGGLPQYELDQKILERDTADKDLQQVRLEISRLNQTRDLSSLKSPVKGLVLSVPVEIGQRINTGDELVSLAGGVGPYIMAFVDAMDVERIHIGQSVIFSVQEDSGMRRKGRIKEIGRAVASSQRPNSVKVVVEPLESIQDLRISQQLYVEFVVLEEASVIRIPRELLYVEGVHQVVYVLTEQGVIAKPIQTQSGDVSFARVISGVALTDRLVLKPQNFRGSP